MFRTSLALLLVLNGSIWYGGAAATETIFDEIARAIHKAHIDHPPAASTLRMFQDSIANYLRTLDPHSDYIPPNEYQSEIKRTMRELSGIGVELAPENDALVIIPFLNGPAYRTGITDRTLLRAVDGRSVEHLNLDDAGDLLLGSPGTEITLTVETLSGGELRNVTVVRSSFRPRSVELVNDSQQPYIRIRHFVTHETMASLAVTLRHMKSGDYPIVVDLRESIGGDLYEALDSVSLFLPGKRLIATAVDAAGERRPYYTLPDRQVIRAPILLLVGPDTASAAEVFAMALQHYDRALLIGQRTRGKCTSQTLVELSDGSALKLTNLKLLGPSGAFCNGQGLIPDIRVPQEQLYETNLLLKKGLSALERSAHS